MQRRRFGRTGLMVSELSLGTVELGMEYGIAAGTRKPDEAQAVAVLNQALDSGINLLDTARAYGDAEAIIGRALRGRRKQFVLVSKVAPYPGRPDRVRRSVEESLAALQTDYIEVMLIHCGAAAQADEDTAAALLRCREAGLIGFLGASVYGEAAALAAMRSGWCECIEVAFSALDRRPEASVLPEAARLDAGVLARSVLLKGALTPRCGFLSAAFAPLRDAVECLRTAAQASLEDLPEISYRYVLGRVPPHTALVGTADIDELCRCVRYADRGALPDEVSRRIRALPMPSPDWLNPGLWPSG